MGACCTSTKNTSGNSTEDQIKNQRKSKMNQNLKVDVNMEDSRNEDENSKLEKTSTATCLINGDLEQLEKILKSTDVNDYNGTNKNFFHEAILKTNKVDIVKMLIYKKRANPNLPETETGNTPIFLAAIDLKVDIVKLLLENGANVLHINHEKQNVIEFLKEWNNENINAKRRSSLKRELSPEEKANYDEIIQTLEAAYSKASEEAL